MKQVVIVLSVLALAAAEVAVTRQCPDADVPDHTICQISEVRITPCARVKSRECPMKRGTNTTLSFDFTPNFSATSLKTMVYWPSASGDLAFAGLGSDNACDYTPCPTEQGSPQQFNYNLYLGKKLPKGIYVLKWKVWDEANVSQICCFLTTINIKK